MPENPNRNKIVRIIWIIWPFLLAIFIFIFIKVAEKNPLLTEHYYSRGIYPVIAGIFSFFSHVAPFSLWDFLWVLIIISIVAGIILIFIKKIRTGWYILKIFQISAILYSLFYISWGFNYFRPGLEKRLNWNVPAKDENLFRSDLDSVIIGATRNYISISDSDYRIIDSLVEISYSLNSHRLAINYPNGSRRPKTMTFSSFFSKTGISGYFGPFFNEVHINHFLLPVDYPFVLAHEKAHQFGMTNEAEANLAAFIICTESHDQRLRYSGYQALLLYFLKDASKLKDYKEIFSTISKPVIDDLKRRTKYYQGLQNEKLADVQQSANDIYLKANKIEAGVMNYNQVISLVISWYSNTDK